MKKLLFFFIFSTFVTVTYAQTYWSTSGNEALAGDILGTLNEQPLIFKTDNEERMRLTKEDGFLGIGTNNPEALLHLNTTHLNQVNLLQVSKLNQSLVLKSSNKVAHASPYMLLEYETEGIFAIEGLSSGIQLTNTGTVEVYKKPYPVIQPSYILSVQGDANIQGGLSAQSLWGQSAKVTGNASVGGNLGIGINNPTQKLHVVGTSYFNGNVGIKTDTPTVPLHVEGNAFVNGNVGILTNTPTAPLHVHQVNDTPPTKGDSVMDRGTVQLIQLSTSSKYTNNTLNFGVYSSGSHDIILKQNNDANFILRGSSGSGIIIAPSGNVGISNLNVSSILTAANANITGTLTVNTLSLQNANIAGTLTANLITAPAAKIAGTVCANEVVVSLSGNPCWPDFVFAKDYELLPLSKVEQFISENQHLPNVPSESEVEANGVNIGEMNAKLLQKVEELTLYIIDLQKQINELKKQ